MTVKDVVAQRIRNLCASRGIRFNELATISGVTPSTIYSLLDCRRRDVSVIIRIKSCAMGLEITLGDFFPRPNSMHWIQEIR